MAEVCRNEMNSDSASFAMLSNFSPMHTIVTLLCQLKHSSWPHVVIGTTEGSSKCCRKDHRLETSSTFINGTSCSTIKNILCSFVHAKVLDFFIEDPVNQFTCHDVEKDCSGCIVGEPRGSSSNIVKVCVDQKSGGSTSLRWRDLHTSIETTSSHSQDVGWSYLWCHLLHKLIWFIFLEYLVFTSWTSSSLTANDNLLVVVHVCWHSVLTRWWPPLLLVRLSTIWIRSLLWYTLSYWDRSFASCNCLGLCCIDTNIVWCIHLLAWLIVLLGIST